MIALIAVVIALIALVRVTQVERELRALRARLDGRRPDIVPAPLEQRAAPQARPPERSAAPPAAGEPGTHDPAAAAAPPIPEPSDAAAPQSPAPDHDDAGTFERRIGERLLLYAGMLVLVLGVAFFLRYAFDHEWMSPAVRVMTGGAGGLVLVAAGRRLARAGLRRYGLFLSGGGLAVLFLSVYAAHAFYALLGAAPAFALLAAVAATAAVVAGRESSLPLAFVAVCGGFATPFLVGGRTDAQLLLFSYDALLVAATMYLAHRQNWPWLNLASFVFTVLTVIAWADAYYTSARYLRTELFLTLYCVMFLAILRENRRSRDPQAQFVSALLWSAPLLYHAGSLAILQAHGTAFLVYLLLTACAVVVGSIETGKSFVRLIGWYLVAMPLMLWIATYGSSEWRTGTIVASVGLWVVFLANHVRMALRTMRLGGLDVALVHASGIGAFAGIYLALREAGSPAEQASAAAILGLVNAGVWWALRRRDASALHWLGLSLALAAVAVAIWFEGQWAVVLWAVEGAALVWIGVRTDRDAFRVAGLVLFAVSLARWIVEGAPGREAPFVVLLNARALAGAAVVGLLYLAGWAMRGVRAGTDVRWRVERAVALVAASAVTVLLVSLEISTYWTRQAADGDARLALHLMLSAWWASYAGVLIAVGMRRRYAPVRYFAIVLFAATLLKVFVVDIRQLVGIYRVIGFLAVGAILLLVSFLYQRARLPPGPGR